MQIIRLLYTTLFKEYGMNEVQNLLHPYCIVKFMILQEVLQAPSLTWSSSLALPAWRARLSSISGISLLAGKSVESSSSSESNRAGESGRSTISRLTYRTSKQPSASPD